MTSWDEEQAKKSEAKSPDTEKEGEQPKSSEPNAEEEE
jgi:hypothetical protein